MEYEEQKECRICKSSKLEDIISLGSIYPSNFVESDDGFSRVPLVLCRCIDCGLVQLRHTVNLDSMYRQYYYRSGLNPSMVAALGDIVDKAKEFVELNENDVVLDIGCNDGTLFKLFNDPRLTYVGFDPALNLADEARKNSTYFINDYFNVKDYAKDYKIPLAKVVTSIAMFYDLPDPNKFISDVKQVLSTNGIWIIQFTDLKSMLEINAFDNICHEHLEYYSLTDMVNILGNFGLEIIDVSHNKVNGGSIRVVVAHKGFRKPSLSVEYSLNSEREFFNGKVNRFELFRSNVETIKANVLFYLQSLVENGKTVYGLGASTKGNTLLQYFGIGGTYINKIADVNKEKWGLKTIGTNIPIISQEQALEEKPDAFFVLIWHFINTLYKNKQLWEYLETGSMIVPMPEPLLYFKTDGRLEKIPLTILKPVRTEGNISYWELQPTWATT